MAVGARKVKLVRPTDFDILDALDRHGRNVAPNIALHIGRDKDYINTRLPQLADYGLVEKIGPADRSGLYEITCLGRDALKHRDEYENPDQFSDLLGL